MHRIARFGGVFLVSMGIFTGSAASVFSETLGPNLILNPSVELLDANNQPANWYANSWGNHNELLTFPVVGYQSANGLRVAISGYIDGDSKWYFEDVAVSPGNRYRFSDYFSSNVQSDIYVRFHVEDDSFKYQYMDSFPAVSSYAQAVVEFVVPEHVISLTVFHVIAQNGQLQTDNFALQEVFPENPPTTNPDNLILNPDLEGISSPSKPLAWLSNSWGELNAVFNYPVAGVNDSRAVEVRVIDHEFGDAKWYFEDVAVAPGKEYLFADKYRSDVPTDLYTRHTLSNGAYKYDYVATLPASGEYTNALAQFRTPENAVSVTVFHVIAEEGYLQTDAFSLKPEGLAPLPTSGNLIANPDFELQGIAGQPQNWFQNQWGTLDAGFYYPAQGVNNSKAAQVALYSHQFGDAKWVFDPVTVSQGIYRFETDYRANVPSYLVVSYRYSDGSFENIDLGMLPANTDFEHAFVDIAVPSDVPQLTVLHYIDEVGSLTIDNASLKLKETPGGIFATGAVSLSFDDGYLSQYLNAIPAMNAAGMPGTFYIITRSMGDTDPEFMTPQQLEHIYAQGHEIGSHTRTHPNLATLNQQQLIDEIEGSRQDLINMGLGPVDSLAYPYGSFNNLAMATVEAAGFISGRSTQEGFTNPASPQYRLPVYPVDEPTTFAQVKQAIDSAIANKEWLILMFHRIDYSGNPYAITPELFGEIIDYLSERNVPVVTVSEGMQSL